MQKLPVTLALLLAASTTFSPVVSAQDKLPPPPVAAAIENSDAAYTRTLEKRTADILAALELKDAAQVKRVQEVLIAQYRALNAWHATNDAPLKALSKLGTSEAKAQSAQILATRKPLHDTFLAKLEADLTPAQIEIVKDKMTYGKVKVTYDGYCEIVPGLTDAEKAHILALLKEAREDALDGGSAEEKSAVFKQYKGKINNYLSTQGHDVSQAYKDWGAQQKARAVAKPAGD